MRKLIICIACAVMFMFQAVPECRAWSLIDDIWFHLQEEIENDSVFGAGVLYVQKPLRDVDDEFYPAPLIVAEYNRFFIDGGVFGYYFNPKGDKLRFALIGSPRLFQAFEGDDSDYLSGMDERKWSFDAGVRVKWLTDDVNVNVEAVGDASGTHQGGELRLMLSKPFFDGLLVPRGGVSWQSGELNNYYYGVKESEVTVDRAAYEAESDLEYVIGLTVNVPVGDKWAVVGDVQANLLGSNVQDSPIVDGDSPMRFVLGTVYRF